MKQRFLRYLSTLEEAQARLAEQAQTLEKENRQDEADLEKIRRNVYGIFVALAKADWAQAQKKPDVQEAFQRLHTQRFECFPQPWRERLEQARNHGDIITCTIEETKLKTVACIQRVFEETGESK